MNKEFILYEQALELKQLGFDEKCLAYYLADTLFTSNDIVYNSTNIPIIKAPLYQQAFRWFREKYELSSWIYNSHLDKYFYTILMNGRIVKANEQSTTYEEAELECLKKLINLVKTK